MADPQAAPVAPAAHADVETAPTTAVRLHVFVAWCAWLLLWLAPSMLLAPRVVAAPAWLAETAAPAALLAAAGLFLVAAWPFFPALAPAAAALTDTPRRGEDQDPPRNPSAVPRRATSPVRLVGLALVELAVLVALAAPFAVVAWSLGKGRLAIGPTAATAGGLGVLGLGLRVAASGGVPSASRWLMAGALLACAGPAALAYAATETLGGSYGWLAEASPVVALVRAGEGWPEGVWLQAARLWLWPAIGGVLGAVGAIISASRAEVERP